MKNKSTLLKEHISLPLLLLIILYSFFLVLSNLFDSRQISILGINLVPGVFLFTFTYIFSDVITEVYGFKYARLAIWIALGLNIFYLAYIWLVYLFPSPQYAQQQDAFKQLVAVNIRVVAASLFSYLVGEPLNSFLIAKIKIKMKGKYVGLRFIFSTVIASFTDSFMFAFGAFLFIFPTNKVLLLAFHIIAAKIFTELIAVIFSVRLSRYLKNINEVDRYDKNTKFNLFSLNTEYSDNTNYFRRKV